MPRSATDATRFTSTTPHASAKTATPSSIPLKRNARTPGPAGETPQEKVRRLRAAADRARDAQISMFDRVIVRGRVWADFAHRVVTLSLIGATFVAGAVTVYALGDMMVYNRRKRAEFYKEQKALRESAIANARVKVESGDASEEDIKFVEMEDAHLAEVKAKANKKGLLTKSKDWLFSGLKKEEGIDGGSSERTWVAESLSEEDNGLGSKDSDVVRAIEEKRTAITDKTKQAFENEKEKQRTGGPLDRLGTAPKRDVDEEPRSGGWTSFMTSRR